MTKIEKINSDLSKPRGRDEIRFALIQAANELFGEKGPDAVSVRDVAKRAEVNHALLHRHFGSKEQLLRDVMAEHAANFRSRSALADDPAESMSQMFQLLIEQPAFVRIVAHLLLSGHQAEEFVTKEGGLALLTELTLAQSDFDDTEAKLSAAMTAALCMGWALFESFVLNGVGFDGEKDEARQFVRRQILAGLRRR